MDVAAYVGFVRADSAALAEAARLGLDAKVPSCPEWTVADLVRHVGRIHRWVEAMVRTGARERPSRDEHDPLPDGEGLVDWFDGVSDALVDTLSAAAPDQPVWNWSVGQPHVAAFWPRRMAHETAVHRWDAQLAHGREAPIPAALAKDGIDEMLDTVVPTEASFKPDATLGGSLHLHTTDVAGEWLVRIGEGTVDVSYEHGKGDAAVRGTAEDLLLFVWGRRPVNELETFGDPAVLANWAAFSR